MNYISIQTSLMQQVEPHVSAFALIVGKVAQFIGDKGIDILALYATIVVAVMIFVAEKAKDDAGDFLRTFYINYFLNKCDLFKILLLVLLSLILNSLLELDLVILKLLLVLSYFGIFGFLAKNFFIFVAGNYKIDVRKAIKWTSKQGFYTDEFWEYVFTANFETDYEFAAKILSDYLSNVDKVSFLVSDVFNLWLDINFNKQKPEEIHSLVKNNQIFIEFIKFFNKIKYEKPVDLFSQKDMFTLSMSRLFLSKSEYNPVLYDQLCGYYYGDFLRRGVYSSEDYLNQFYVWLFSGFNGYLEFKIEINKNESLKKFIKNIKGERKMEATFENNLNIFLKNVFNDSFYGSIDNLPKEEFVIRLEKVFEIIFGDKESYKGLIYTLWVLNGIEVSELRFLDKFSTDLEKMELNFGEINEYKDILLKVVSMEKLKSALNEYERSELELMPKEGDHQDVVDMHKNTVNIKKVLGCIYCELSKK